MSLPLIEYESGMWKESSWTVAEVATNIPDTPKHSNSKAKMYADVSWFELGHLNVGETCKLVGDRYNARFWKLEEDTVMCQLQNGELGVYTHDSDEAWEERRYGADRIMTALVTGERLDV
ncbi:MAG: hypothetical protein GWN93_05920 [Deltaproteobacteria bacterium]|nr:hypothetical protein [Deltaproteobacteria bacterium]